MRDKYVTEDGKINNQLLKDKDKIKKILIIIGIIVFLIIMFFIIRMIVRNSNCGKVIDKINEAALEYAKDEKILPVSEGQYINVKLDDLLDSKLLKNTDITVKEQKATAKIKITKYEKDYFVTTELFNCSYCDTTDDKWSKEISKKPNKNTVDIIAYYNYKEKETNKTPYTKWLSEEELSKKVDKKFDMKLPKDLPEVPPTAKVHDIEREEMTYYSYRDKKCRFYKIQGDYTNYFSSEQPAGYANKDNKTLKYTVPTKYSLNYPEEKEYRIIDKKTGYKFYYLDGKEKVYYNNGEYTVETDLPDDKEYEKDRKKGSAMMYSYKDKQWKWFNGPERVYSTVTTTMPKNYNYVDVDFCEFTNWSVFKNQSYLNDKNKGYREEKTQPMYKFRQVYEIYSLEVLDKYLNINEFEEKMGSNIESLFDREDIEIAVDYKFSIKK